MRTRPPVIALALLLAGGARTHAADQPIRLTIEPAGSEVTFLMETTWHAVHGKATTIAGTIESSGTLFSDARVNVTVDATTLQTGNQRRDRTMHQEIMDTGQWPAIIFRSTAPPLLIEKDAAAGGDVTFELEGDLTIRAETRSVLLSLTARPDGKDWVVTGEHTVSLRDYGIPDPSIFLNKVQDAVKVSFTIRARPAESAD